MKMKHFAILASALAFFAVQGIASAQMKGHDSMPGMKGGGSMEGHGDMMKMGDKVYGGKVGPWQGEARLIDMKAQMEKAKASGMKMEGQMKSHHISLGLTDPKTKKSVTEGKGTLTVTGPDKKETKYDIVAMEGHFGADIDLPKPGKYNFNLAVESGKQKGTARFSHIVK